MPRWASRLTLEIMNVAFESVGITNLSDDDCCAILAWFNNEKGSTEEVVYNRKLNRDLLIAQQRLNLFGGEVPNRKLVVQLNNFRHELENKKDYPDWFRKIEIKYGLKPAKKERLL